MSTIEEQTRDIKRQFRKAMNGIVAASMREKGITYRINFGLTLPLLRRIAASIPPQKELAERLWNESVRESKMLATWLYPPAEMELPTARKWVEEIPYTEIADVCCMNLFPHITEAGRLAADCIGSANDLARYTGYQLWSRLFARKYEPSPEETRHLLTSYLALLCGQVPVHTLSAATGCIERLVIASPQNATATAEILSTAAIPEERRHLTDALIDLCHEQEAE